MTVPRIPDVFSFREVAAAAGVAAGDVRALADAGVLPVLPSGFVAGADAVRAVRMLRGSAGLERAPLTAIRPSPHARRGLPLLASGATHAGVLIALGLATTAGLSTPTISRPIEFKPVRLVFLATPGPGGGGGGGGIKAPAPAQKAQLAGPRRLRSPVPPPAVRGKPRPAQQPRPAQPPQVQPVDRPVAPPPPPLPRPDPSPPVVAPVVPIAGDPVDRSGVLEESAPDAGSRGSGEGGGSGTGAGTGAGEGSGPGIGPGTGGGTGGGPFRPGAGITPPELLREVRPDYTDEARRRNIEGEVVLEIVVRSDGSVGSMRVLQGLGGGLDQRALDAVRQWRFAAARRHGRPVDVLVEVAVEFRLR